MKLSSTVLLIIALFQGSNGYAQKITIDKTNISLEEVLINIHKQTGYSYSASNEVLQNAKRFDIHVKDLEIEQVLISALKDQPLTYSINNKIIIIKNKTRIDVNGWIVNEKDEAVLAMVRDNKSE